MEQPIFICAQPHTYQYTCQVDGMLKSFEINGNVDMNRVHVVGAGRSEYSQYYWNVIRKKWSKKGVLFEYYLDTRTDLKYQPSIQPHVLEKHWEKHPYLTDEFIFHHDCDIVLTKPISFENKLHGNKCYLSNTVSYIGAKYIESKGYNLLEEMCNIVNIPIETVRKNEDNSGGAQYLFSKGISSQFWKNVYEDSINLYNKIEPKCNKIKNENPNWASLQTWTAGMWAYLWNLWKEGYETEVHEDFNFTWAVEPMEKWDENPIYHDSGISDKWLEKQDDKNDLPYNKQKLKGTLIPMKNVPRPSDKWASQKYYDLLVDAWHETLYFLNNKIIENGEED
tara:strand:+ start:4719 stop:5729 length:1011 start_codon:yes stop_codon:yes gene_type:complete